MSRRRGNCPIVVESVGADMGGAVVDELIDLGHDVTEFKPAGAPSDENYFNLRAQAWDYVAKLFDDGDVELKNTESQLVTQLCTPTYYYKRGRMLVEEKEDIKARLGRSPDRADALVIGYWELQFVEPVAEQIDDYGRRRSKRPASAMVC